MTRKFTLSALLVAGLSLVWWLGRSQSDETKKAEFTSGVIDLGTCVADVEKSVKFYTEVVGFKELPSFDVAGDFAKNVGLTSGSPMKVHVLALADGDRVTKLKLFESPKDKPKKNDNEYVHSELGFRYLTIYVSDTTAALERLKKAGVKTVANSPVEIGRGSFLTLVRDPDGNLIELIGAKK